MNPEQLTRAMERGYFKTRHTLAKLRNRGLIVTLIHDRLERNGIGVMIERGPDMDDRTFYGWLRWAGPRRDELIADLQEEQDSKRQARAEEGS